MGDKNRGLYAKFQVERIDGSNRHNHCDYYVLDVTHDPHALPALEAYAKSARIEGYEQLADELDAKVARRREGLE